MSGSTRRAVLVLCTTAAVLATAAPAAAERRVYFTIKSVTGLYHSEYDIPRAVAPNEGDGTGCPTVYRSERGREHIELRSTRPVRANSVYDTRARPRHWRMNVGGPLRYPVVETVSREYRATQDRHYHGGCYWEYAGMHIFDESLVDCGGPETYRVPDTLLTIGPHTVRNGFEVENWLGPNPAGLPGDHPVADCAVPSAGPLRADLQSVKDGMWQIARGRWKRKTLRIDRTFTGERCIGSNSNGPGESWEPRPPCGPVTTRLAWTVKLVRRPDPRKR